MSSRDGGPAFPHHDAGDTGTRPGMSLRDWFAGQAVSSMCANPAIAEDILKADSPIGLVAASAYEIADAMLAQRDKDGQP